MPRLLLTLPVLAILFLAVSTALLANSFGPINGVTGAPGELNCSLSGCHSAHPANTGIGSVTVNAPGSYVPGDTLEIQVEVEHSGQIRWGFESTVLDGANLPSGSILITDTLRTQSSLDTVVTGREYAKHTSIGTDSGTVNSSPGWSFSWIAPSAGGGLVTVYVAGNAANGNGVNDTLDAGTADWIYTTSTTIDEAFVSVAQSDVPIPASEGFALQARPNPFNPVTRITYHLNAPGEVNVSIHDLSGRLVQNLTSAYQTSGDHEVIWNGSGRQGTIAASGSYLVSIKAAGESESRTIRLVR